MPLFQSPDANRRRFLQTAAAGIGAAAFPRVSVSRNLAAKKPNILFIISDEHDPAVTGCLGDPLVQTPNLDRLARSGVIFGNCYTTSPICVPARLSFTSGQYISRNGAWSNNTWLPSDGGPTIARVMESAGYTSLLSGKMHYDKTRRYGFTELVPGAYFTNQYNKTGKGGRRRPDDESVNRKSWEQRSSNFYAGDNSEVLDHDRKVTAHVSEFLGQWRKEDDPFFLVAGYLAPHFPLIVPQAYYDPYKDKVPMPVIPEGHLESLPLNYKHVRRGFGVTDTDPAVVQKGRDLYWGLTHWFDVQVGRILEALDHSEAADNTIVIYTTDHGENKGDHGMWWKNCMFETAARIPLLVSFPARWAGGQRRSGVCSMVDIVQTLADLGGAETPGDWDGQSLAPCLDDPAGACPDFAVSEYYAHNIASGFVMYREGPYKYVYHTRMSGDFGPERELYDLEADPNEFDNLAKRAEHAERIEAMHKSLVKELGRDPDETEQICRADYERGYDR